VPDNEDKVGGWPVHTIIGVLMTMLLSGSLAWATTTITKSSEEIAAISREVAVIRNDLAYIKRDVDELRSDARPRR